jgi:prolyl-tRNA editing enzyme YbaK/EbsC (Cys-tRNA(Pro) deacylase)
MLHQEYTVNVMRVSPPTYLDPTALRYEDVWGSGGIDQIFLTSALDGD